MIMNKILTQFECANHLPQIACFISYEKWVEREKRPIGPFTLQVQWEVEENKEQNS